MMISTLLSGMSSISDPFLSSFNDKLYVDDAGEGFAVVVVLGNRSYVAASKTLSCAVVGGGGGGAISPISLLLFLLLWWAGC